MAATPSISALRGRRRRVVVVIATILASTAGCAALLGIEDTNDDPALGRRDASSDAGGGDVVLIPTDTGVGPTSDSALPDGAPLLPCPSIHGQKMVRLQAGFCVDPTEVTRGEYAAFMAASVSTSTQAPECAFNTNFAPSGWPYPGTADLAVPAAVNWCDAVAYCKWAGKRLCGSRADGGVVAIAQGSDPAVSEWASACSHDGARAYAYGNTFQPSTCNGAARDAGRVIATGSSPGCEGGDPGVFDMSGNAWEWDLTCVMSDAGQPKMCGQRGGSYTDQANLLVCALSNYQAIALTTDSSGFRCCAK